MGRKLVKLWIYGEMDNALPLPQTGWRGVVAISTIVTTTIAISNIVTTTIVVSTTNFLVVKLSFIVYLT